MPSTAAADFTLPVLTPPAGLSAPSALSAAEALLVEARGEADAIREQARAEGHAEGLAAAQDEVAHAVSALQAAAVQVQDGGVELATVLEEQAVELALAIAAQVLGGVLDVRPEVVVDVVRGGLRRLVDRERVTLLVHPDDLDCVRAAVPALLTELGGIEHCEVQAERRVARGGAIVRTGDGEVDATLDGKLARAREVVARSLAKEPGDDPA